MKNTFSNVLTLGFLLVSGLQITQAQASKKPISRKPAPATVAAPRPAAAPASPRPAAAPARPAAPAPTTTTNSPAASSADGPFSVATNAVNLGVGIGSRYGYGGLFTGGSSSVSPALSLSYERGILALGPGVLGVGGIVGYQGASYDYGGGDKFTYTDIILMVRGAFHYPVSAQFDAYAGLGLGIRSLRTSFSGPAGSIYNSIGATASVTDATSGVFVGGRYFFTSNIGAFAELGYDQTYLKVGLAAKF